MPGELEVFLHSPYSAQLFNDPASPDLPPLFFVADQRAREIGPRHFDALLKHARDRDVPARSRMESAWVLMLLARRKAVEERQLTAIKEFFRDVIASPKGGFADWAGATITALRYFKESGNEADGG
jgi:hypothetical protein